MLIVGMTVAMHTLEDKVELYIIMLMEAVLKRSPPIKDSSAPLDGQMINFSLELLMELEFGQLVVVLLALLLPETISMELRLELSIPTKE